MALKKIGIFPPPAKLCFKRCEAIQLRRYNLDMSTAVFGKTMRAPTRLFRITAKSNKNRSP
jgi:hypothetical protein